MDALNNNINNMTLLTGIDYIIKHKNLNKYDLPNTPTFNIDHIHYVAENYTKEDIPLLLKLYHAKYITYWNDERIYKLLIDLEILNFISLNDHL